MNLLLRIGKNPGYRKAALKYPSVRKENSNAGKKSRTTTKYGSLRSDFQVQH